MDKVLVALAAVGGGLVSALLGWMESKEAFDARKFGGSAIRALVAGGVFAAGYELTAAHVGAADLLYAVLGGAGVDVIGNRVGGKIASGSFPLPASAAKAAVADPVAQTTPAPATGSQPTAGADVAATSGEPTSGTNSKES